MGYGPAESLVHFFFKNGARANVTVNGTRYSTMITDYLLPEIEALDLDNIWFQKTALLAIQPVKQ